ncbi:MAG: iron-sulfur cluster repair di-iron protein [Aureliella sp.]
MSTAALDSHTAVGQWVRQFPATSRVFDKYGIDFCCGGKAELSSACAKKGLSVDAVEAELQRAIDTAAASPDEDVDALSLSELCDKIVREHHDLLREELPRLAKMVNKVVHVHGQHYRWLAPLQVAFHALTDELVPHMFKEEHILFPAIKRIEAAQAVPNFPFGSIDNPIHVMEHEHDNAGSLLAEMRRLSSDYTIPSEACNTFRAMLDGLRELEADMHLHVHRENNVLFVKASQLADALSAGQR